ncbi:MAG: SO_0444 family Cu/Zn efflux transporter [Phycisphaerae bacterium]
MDIAQQIIVEFWDVLLEMAPYLLLGFAVAGILSVLVRPEWVEKHLGGRGIGAVAKASLFGVPLPLCSCGVIPVAASLRRHGAGKGATTAFLISTPQTGVDSVLVTFSLLGSIAAVFRPLAALVSGIVGGAAVSLLQKEPPPKAPAEGTDPDTPDVCEEACCATTGGNRWIRGLKYGFVTLPADIGRALLIGVLIAGLISALVPPGQLPGVLGGGIVAMLIVMVASIPMYVCATASVPIAAALVAQGVSPGAAMVFLMTGPATNAATIATLWKTMGKRTATIYLLSVAITALAAGIVLDYVFNVIDAKPAPPMTHVMPHWLKLLSALALLGILGYGWLKPTLASWMGKRAVAHADAACHDPLEPQQLAGQLHGSNHPAHWHADIVGMHCSHCAAAVEKAVRELPGVAAVHADAHRGSAEISGHGVEPAGVRQAVESLGYRVEDLQEKTPA